MSLEIEGAAPLLGIFDMPTSIAFYRDVLGFQVVATSEPAARDDVDWALLRRDDVKLMLNTMYEADEPPPAPDPIRIAAHADTSLFFGCRDLDAAYAHLKAKGVDAKEPVVRDYGMTQLWLTDPDGYNVCFQWPAT